MSEAAKSLNAPAGNAVAKVEKAPERIVLVPYPKIVFLYPMFLAALGAAIWMSFLHGPLEAGQRSAVIVSVAFLIVMGLNMVILAFDFPRTTSLTLFFLAVALVLGGALVAKLKPELLPRVAEFLSTYHPLANATFYWTTAAVLAVLFVAVVVATRFDYWEVRPNELLHHHGFLSNLERFGAPNLRIDKEINDVFEYFLLKSGRLILHPSNERRAIILDNVPFIGHKEAAITRMLGALQVQVRTEEGER